MAARAGTSPMVRVRRWRAICRARTAVGIPASPKMFPHWWQQKCSSDHDRENVFPRNDFQNVSGPHNKMFFPTVVRFLEHSELHIKQLKNKREYKIY